MNRFERLARRLHGLGLRKPLLASVLLAGIAAVSGPPGVAVASTPVQDTAKPAPKHPQKSTQKAAQKPASQSTLKTAVTPAKLADVKPSAIHTLPNRGPAIPTPQAFCDVVGHRLPNVSRAACARARLQMGSARSAQGRPLFERDVVAPNAHLRVLVIGGIHGDELSSTALVLNWISAAEETPSNIHWRFVPLVNPDGMLAARPVRTNANGVDLNRNFPTPNWDKEAPYYWNQRTRNDPRRYPGPQPLSEPESRWLHAEMEAWKPDLIVSVHAPYGVLDFDGPTVPPRRLGRLYLDQVGIYPGSLGNYGGVHKKLPVVTIELPSALRTPQEAEIRQMWLDLLRWTAERLGAG
jgi:hypothetical protein